MEQTRGEGLRRAVALLAELRRERPGTPLIRLIDEASRRTNLNPAESESLLRLVLEGAGKQPPDGANGG